MESKKFTNRHQQKQKLTMLTKGILAAAGISVAGIFIYLTTFFNATGIAETRAELHARSMMGYDISDGQVIASYTWDDKNEVVAKSGPDVIENSKSNTDYMIPSENEFNTEGIDISFDFKRTVETCDFYSRGTYFNFGMKKGKIIISYRVSVGNGKNQQVNEMTKYEIPKDDETRNYRFAYDPQKGRGEIMVNGVTVWSHAGTEQAALYWNSSDNVVIGRNMITKSTDLAGMDNLVIKSTTHVNKMPIHLLDFEALSQDGHVMVRWFTIKETDVDSFRVERSTNGTDFEMIGCIKATGNSTTLQAYALADMHPVENTASYYRLVPSNKPLKSICVPVIGYKYRKDHIENMPVEKVEAQVKEQIENSAGKK